MALNSGFRLGPYQILALLGAGGMGEVYRARDTRLKREVAIKVLPASFALDQGRRARFAREAELLATLNHPRIASVYGLEQAADITGIVLELVEGLTLAERLTAGAIPLEDALPIAAQIAEALDAAHEKGIIHRDLKPANIKLRPDGTVKVLDFGLAKSLERAEISDVSAESPTALNPIATLAGTIQGTAAYMAPEQARGKDVDKRADIWAFGCVLFEMLTGRAPFGVETVTDTLAAILRNEPDWHALPDRTPAVVERLIARCLKKDPAQRLHDIADARFQLEDAMNEPRTSAAGMPVPAQWRRASWIAVPLLLGATLFFATRPSATQPRDAISFAVFPQAGTVLSARSNATVNVPSFAISPDGHDLVFSAESPGGRPMLWLRSIDRVEARQLAGTEDAQDPFWSPDSRWIAFFAAGQLKKIQRTGGAVEKICEPGTDFRGGSWGPDDTILFGITRGPISSVNSAGGRPIPVTGMDRSRQDNTHRSPYFLPDGHHFLYSIFSSKQDQNGVYAGSLDGNTKKLLVAVSTSAVYAPPGYLLFVDGDNLLAQSFDADRLEVQGRPFLVAEHVGRTSAFMSAVSGSRTGTIAYAGTLSQSGRLSWYDRGGHALEAPGTPEGDYADFRLSPDEKRLAASLVDRKAGAIEIWLTELGRKSTFRVESGGLVAASPVWSPDGTRLAFRTNRSGTIEFYQRSAGGGGSDQPLLLQDDFALAQIPSNNLVPTDWSPDGGDIVFSVPGSDSGYDLWMLPVAAPAKARKFIASAGDQFHGNFSPDGRLVAYTSNESGRFEVYVETVPRSDRKWPVSTNGGYEPRWRTDGREIFFLSEDRKLMAVQVDPGPSFGVAKELFQTKVAAGVTPMRTHYVAGGEGRRFLVNDATDRMPSPITVVVNWTAALKK